MNRRSIYSFFFICHWRHNFKFCCHWRLVCCFFVLDFINKNQIELHKRMFYLWCLTFSHKNRNSKENDDMMDNTQVSVVEELCVRTKAIQNCSHTWFKHSIILPAAREDSKRKPNMKQTQIFCINKSFTKRIIWNRTPFRWIFEHWRSKGLF